MCKEENIYELISRTALAIDKSINFLKSIFLFCLFPCVELNYTYKLKLLLKKDG